MASYYHSFWSITPPNKGAVDRINNLADEFVRCYNIISDTAVLNSLEECVAELQRLREVHLPQFAGKIGEPDVIVLVRAEAELAKVKALRK